MQTLVYSMAVLSVRLIVVWMSLLVFKGINWNKLMKQADLKWAYGVYVLTSVAVGHLVGTYLITLIELLQQLVLASIK